MIHDSMSSTGTCRAEEMVLKSMVTLREHSEVRVSRRILRANASSLKPAQIEPIQEALESRAGTNNQRRKAEKKYKKSTRQTEAAKLCLVLSEPLAKGVHVTAAHEHEDRVDRLASQLHLSEKQPPFVSPSTD
jgi:hypothetical protein